MNKLLFDRVYNNKDKYYSALYQLLAEREEFESISHNDMPTWQQHFDFIERVPYKCWYIILDNDIPVGSVYVSHSNEIGIAIFKKYRRMGYAKETLDWIINVDSIKEPFFLANINPANTKSIELFRNKLGFTEIQRTFKFERKNNAIS